mgnify:FL=1
MRKINQIIIHCTATRADWWAKKSPQAKVNEVRRWHVKERGWSDIGYHFLIDRNGAVVAGRPIEISGAHVRGQNSKSIGVALFGGHGGSVDDSILDNFTPEQEESLLNLIKSYPEIKHISGHNQYAAKACPCFDVNLWYKSKNKKRWWQ